MSDRSSMARWLLIGGGAQALISLILWWAIPIHMSFPPYLVTAFLIVAYGAVSLKSSRPRSVVRKPQT